MEKRALERLVRRAATGRSDAAADLFAEFHPRVYRYALGKLRSHADAEEVAAETFARVVEKLDRFRWRGGGFEAWIFRIAANLVVDRVRGRDRTALDIEMLENIGDPSTPEESAIASEEVREMIAALERLSEDQREVLLLRFAGGLDAATIGRTMGRKANAVRQLQFRALTSLKEEYGRTPI